MTGEAIGTWLRPVRRVLDPTDEGDWDRLAAMETELDAVLAAHPIDLPDGLHYEEFEGGKYSCLTYTGPYSELGPVSGRAWEIALREVAMRPGFAIENYVNDPQTTPEGELITEILIPTA